MNIRFQGVTQLRSGFRDQDPAKDLPPTPTSSYQWREDRRCPRCDDSPNSADCECRWSRTCLQRDRCNVSAANASATRSATVDTHHVASLVGAPTSPVGALPERSSLSAVVAGETTRRTTVYVLSGKRRGLPLQSKRLNAVERASPLASLPLRKPRRPAPLPSRWVWARGGTTSS